MPSPSPTFLHRPAWVRARPGHRLLTCSVVAGVCPGGERILAWAAAAWPHPGTASAYPSHAALGSHLGTWRGMCAGTCVPGRRCTTWESVQWWEH